MKRRHKAAEWKTLVEEYLRSGRTQKEFCEARGISVSSLHSRLRSDFVEVSDPPSRSSTELEVTFADGTVVRIRG